MRRRDILKAIAAAPIGVSTDFRASAAARSSAARFRVEPHQYTADWNSLNARPMPPWYTDAKFGIFIHWGVYSVPAFAPVNVKDETPYAEWYWHSLTEGKKATGPTGNGALTWAFHKRVYGADFPYFDFAPMFRAEFFDPDRWADVISRSGARYVALTSKHHEGFTLWRSAEANRDWGRPWNSVDIGPKRDLVLELSEAGRRRGLRMGIYYSLYEWYNPLWLSDKKRYVAEHLFPQFKDVVTHVKPSIIFSDGEWEMTSAEWRSPELLAWLFNDSPVADEVVIDDRWGKDTRHKDGGYFTTEYTSGLQRSQHPWEESRGMGFSYGYNRMETLQDYRTNRELVLMLIDIVSRGGNLLLDIGPTADGRIPVIMEERLIEVGNWLRPNAEAIYGTHAFERSRQWSNGTVPRMEDRQFMAEYDITKLVDTPPLGYARTDAFFTAKNDVVYALLPRRPPNEMWFEDLVPRHTAKVTLLESGDELRWQLQGSRLRVEVPESLRSKLPHREAYVLKMVGVGGP